MTAHDPAARYADLLAAHGADIARWPADARAQLPLLRAATPDAARLEHEAAALDALLDATTPPPPPAASLRSSILDAAMRTPQLPVAFVAGGTSPWQALIALWRDLGGTRLAAPAFAMALACGIGLGWMLQPGEAMAATQDSDDLLALVQFEDHYTELSP